MGSPRGGGYNDEDPGTTTPVVPASTDSQVTAQQAAAGQGGGQPTASDPTTPLGDGSAGIQSALTGPGTGTASGSPTGTTTSTPSGTTTASGPLFGTANQKIAGLQTTKGAPPRTDYTGTYHNITEKDYKQNQSWDKQVGDKFAFGPISNNDLDRIHFGIEEPAKVSAARTAHSKGQAQLGQLAKTINGGDIDAIGTAEEILKPGEAGLQFFQFFAPAYNEWKGGGITYDAAKQAYEAEYGMSFTAYSTDSKTLADLSQQLTTIQQNLNTPTRRWCRPGRVRPRPTSRRRWRSSSPRRARSPRTSPPPARTSRHWSAACSS